MRWDLSCNISHFYLASKHQVKGGTVFTASGVRRPENKQRKDSPSFAKRQAAEAGRKREGEEGEGEVRVPWPVAWLGSWVPVHDLARGIPHCTHLAMGQESIAHPMHPRYFVLTPRALFLFEPASPAAARTPFP